MPNGRETGRSFRMQKGGRNMKRLITAVIIATCMALCAAVWPQTATVEETTPLPALTPAVTAPEAPAAGIKLEAEIDPPTEKEKDETSQPEPPHEPNESETEPVEAPAAPEVQPTPEPEPAPEPPRRKRSQISSPATWFMWRASAGWSTRGRITANTVRTFMRTATRSASWVKT